MLRNNPCTENGTVNSFSLQSPTLRWGENNACKHSGFMYRVEITRRKKPHLLQSTSLQGFFNSGLSFCYSWFWQSLVDKVSTTTSGRSNSVSIMSTHNDEGLANGDQGQQDSDGGPDGEDDLAPDVVERIRRVLNKPRNGSKILLDWNAFDPGAAIKENDVKNVWERLLEQDDKGIAKDDPALPPLPYNRAVSLVLRQRMFDLKKDMLKYAKNKAYNCMIQASMRRGLKTMMGIEVKSISALRKVRTDGTRNYTCSLYVSTNTILQVLQGSGNAQP